MLDLVEEQKPHSVDCVAFMAIELGQRRPRARGPADRHLKYPYPLRALVDAETAR